MSAHVRVELPGHLCTLAKVEREVVLVVAEPVTVEAVLDALESAYPVLEGTVREHVSKRRRAFLRFFLCQEDWSHVPVETVLPDAVVRGEEAFLVIGAVAGGCEVDCVRSSGPGRSVMRIDRFDEFGLDSCFRAEQ